MTINSPKDLETLAKSMRKLGVESLKIGDIEITLGPMPSKQTKRPTGRPSALNRITTSELPPSEEIPSEGFMSEEELLFYSVQEQVTPSAHNF